MANADTQAAGEWVAHSQAGYFMRADPTDAGRLVRVADVVRWLMRRKELPLTEAVAAACDALEQATPAPALFYVTRTERARPVPENERFGFHTEASWAAAKAKQLQDTLQREHEARDRSEWAGGFANPSGWRNDLEFRNGRISARSTKPQLVEPGFAAAVLCMRQSWASARDIEARLDSAKLHAAHFAVTLNDAAVMWGYRPGCPQGASNGDQVRIEPPAGWRIHSAHGYMGADATPAGRLVRLADLVQWLMKEKELPCAAAVGLVCDALAVHGADKWLYLLNEAGYAKQLPAGHSFDYSPSHSFWETVPPPSPDDAGIAGAIKHMRGYWAESAAPGAGNVTGQHVLEPLAIRLDKAYELWGYGNPVDDALAPAGDRGGNGAEKRAPELPVLPAILAQRGGNESHWSPEEDDALARYIEQYDAVAGRGGRTAAAKALDVKPSRITQRLKEREARIQAARRGAALGTIELVKAGRRS